MEKPTSLRLKSSTDIVKVEAEDGTQSTAKVQNEEENLLSFPPGYRFAPRDDELIEHYRMNKIANRRLPINKIKDVNIYKFNPQDLAAMYNSYGDREKQWYFFTPRDRKYPNGNRPNRAAGNGYWKATGADKDIMTKTKGTYAKIGCKKVLVFYVGKAPNGKKTKWIMQEYRIDRESPRSRSRMRLDDWVLCRIYEKTNLATPTPRARPRPKKMKKMNAKGKPLEMPPEEDRCNINPVSTTSESNNNQTSSSPEVSGISRHVFDEDEREQRMAIREGMGMVDPESHSYGYFLEAPSYLCYENFQPDFMAGESIYGSMHSEFPYSNENDLYATLSAFKLGKEDFFGSKAEEQSHLSLQYNVHEPADFLTVPPPPSPLDM